MKNIFLIMFLFLATSVFAVPYGEYQNESHLLEYDGEIMHWPADMNVIVLEGQFFIGGDNGFGMPADTSGEVVYFNNEGVDSKFYYSAERDCFIIEAEIDGKEILFYFHNVKRY